jgi:PKD repeat protein
VSGRRSPKSLRTHTCGLAALLALLGASLLVLAAGAAPAGAIVLKLHGRALGVTPVNNARGNAFARAHTRARRLDEAPGGGGALTYHGGPVMHSSTTHVIYWDPNEEFSATTKGIVDKYFTDTAHDSLLGTNVFAIEGQFTDKTGFAAYESTSTPSLADANSYPGDGCETPEFEADPGPYSKCLNDEQLREELQTFISAKGLPTGPTQFYALVLPHKVVTCFEEFGEVCSNDIFCAYHSSIKPGTAGEILYADIPFSLLDTNELAPGIAWAKGCQDDGHDEDIQQPNPDNAGGKNTETRFADVAVKYISHEYNETITDPLGTGWWDANELEDGDKCNGVTADPKKDGIGYDKNSFLPVLGGEAAKDNLFNQIVNGDHFYVQAEWDNVAKACRMTPLPITGVSFTSSPASPAEKSPVEFKGKGTDPYEHAEFRWDFGDGSEATGASPTHVYELEGTYEATLTVRDARTRSSATVTHTIEVDELPEAFFAFEPEEALVGEAVKFDGSESEDLDGTIEKYSWDFGDGGKATGAKVSHKYTKPGEYEVVLTVEDSSKLTGQYEEFVIVYDVPTPVTGAASAITQASATLNGSVNPNGAATECRFEYGETEAYGKEAPCSAPPPGSEFEPVAVSAAIGELAPATTYHYRLLASNLAGEREGSDKTFTTLAKTPPTVAAEAATSIAQTTASLNATVNPNGAEVSECKFEYGTSVFYDKVVPCASLPLGAGTSPLAVSAAITGLTAGTTYHFRLVAKSAAGAGEGSDATFTTTALPPPPPKEEVKAPPPDSSFTAGAGFSRSNGAITLSATVKDPGKFTVLATFANGKFGVFSAAAKCKKGSVRLAGKCRPAKITFAKGTVTVPAAGTVKLTLKPSASARKALTAAAKRKKGVAVTITLAFSSARGGTPTSHTLSIVVKLKKK